MSNPDRYAREELPTIAEDLSAEPAIHRPKKPFVLEQIGGPGAPREIVLDLEETVIGRSLQANVSIDSGSISRRHMALKRTGPEFRCTDLDSSNGVYLNGVKVHSAVLREGDSIKIGDVVFIFHEGS